MGLLVVAGEEIAFPPVFNVASEFIDRHLREGKATKVAVRTRKGDTTYRELFEGVNQTANFLDAAQVGRGERVLMIVKDSVEFFFIFWGAIKAGIVPVPVNTLLRAKDYAFIIENSACAGLIYSPEYAGEVEAALASIPHRPGLVLKIADEGDTLANRIAPYSTEFAAVEASPTDECFWLYSSGSTGNPKGAVHLQRDMVVSSEFYGVRTLGAGEDDVFFSAAKLFFAYGLGNGMTFPLWVGGTAVLLDEKPTPSNTFALIETFRPTLFFGVPTLYAAQLQALENVTPDLSSLRMCVSAGEALPADIFRRWREHTGTLILDGVGSTEALHIFISNRVGQFKPGSSGLVVEGYDAKVVDEAGRTVPTGETGRLFIKGLSMAKYYWRNPEKTAETMLGEWINTGDTYYRDEHGYFFYCGRSDDMLKVGGIWCSPFEIESTLIEHPTVFEVAVVGRSDGEGLVKPEAWIVLNDEARPTEALEDELRTFCKTKLAPYKFPRRFHFVDSLPKTATGKIQRYRLRAEE
ncbi:benzoate-CoA ligase family [Rhodomicrobium vannielii ATCC 17100]|uniref:Benzoate-CoA ligase family n=1 Tax=Rhodomicrobium vannielii (strain ATCC 17100 / DSM 162 / LMG 4299 / NCIMB 10020 / ATH 3.1.1) TaxID=648757 RepID=E3I4Y0_RHOVT|nr:benzoate-CoA ligase family protein [Rhodomicrobium vannielii]ADP69334.1 benzoate-CoA ligase family [Rhodomicrobium vannielii ATCC 17100]